MSGKNLNFTNTIHMFVADTYNPKTENKIRSTVTDADIKKGIRLLKQFGIKVKPKDIPKFTTVGDIDRWTGRLIRDRL